MECAFIVFGTAALTSSHVSMHCMQPCWHRPQRSRRRRGAAAQQKIHGRRRARDHGKSSSRRCLLRGARSQQGRHPKSVEGRRDTQQLRTLLRRDGELVPPDETWTGELCSCMGCRPLRRRFTQEDPRSPDDKPSLREQRLDVSGVDGESLLVAKANPREPATGPSPSSEVQKTIESVCARRA